jgi:abortive infection bacteriophage resistance protein
MKFEKPALQTAEHISLLKERGLEVLDEVDFHRAIDEIGFFRLLGYVVPFQAKKDSYSLKAGTTDQLILRHYRFDRSLRFAVMKAVETIEVAMKATICNTTVMAFGPHWYLEPAHFNRRDHHQKVLDYVADATKESNEQFIKRYREDFHIPSLPPLWMVMEMLTFGKLCSLYSNMKDSDQKKQIAAKFGLPVSILESWLLSLNYIRNCCAHHNRLWNRWLPLRPMIPKRDRYRFLKHTDAHTDKQLFGILSCMLFLLKSIDRDTELRETIQALFKDYPEINRGYMGFHTAWEDEPIWQA